MCGRIGQFSAWQSYIAALMAFREHSLHTADENRPRYNAGPGTKIAVMHQSGELIPEWWGYRPFWAVQRNVPQMINARAAKITGSAWKSMLKSGRVIVPADCWYEWVKEGKAKQPFLLRARDGAPLYLAALTSVSLSGQSGPRIGDKGPGMIDGVVIVTDASDQGMVDIHDRRPVALSAADARHWLDEDTSLEHAAEIAKTANRPIEDFEWFKVSREVNDAWHDEKRLIDPLEDDEP